MASGDFPPTRFFIVNYSNGKVVDVQGGGPHIKAGTPLIVYSEKASDNNNQLWTYDPSSALLRNVGSNLVIGNGEQKPRPGEQLTVERELDPVEANLQWRYNNDENIENVPSGLVLDFAQEGLDSPSVILAEPNGSDTQRWFLQPQQ